MTGPLLGEALTALFVTCRALLDRGCPEVTHPLTPWGLGPPSRAAHPHFTQIGPPRPDHAPN